MKGGYVSTTVPVVQKACHACGQRLPLKVGEIVEGRHTGTGVTFSGIVTSVTFSYASITTLKGTSLTHPIHLLTRLHGYYRITSRESMA